MATTKTVGELITAYISAAAPLAEKLEALKLGTLSFVEIKALNAKVNDLVAREKELVNHGFNPELNGLPCVDMEFFRRDRNEALRSAGVRSEVIELLREKAGIYTPTDLMVLVASKEQVEDLNLESLKVADGVPIYLIPADLVGKTHPSLNDGETVEVGDVDEETIMTAVALYGGEAYSTLHLAFEAAKQF